MNLRYGLIATCVIVVVSSGFINAHAVPTHINITRRAIEYLIRQDPTFSELQTLAQDLVHGAEHEDDDFWPDYFPTGRFFFHFLPKLDDKVMSQPFTGSCSSLEWAFGNTTCTAAAFGAFGTQVSLTTSNVHGWKHALSEYHRGAGYRELGYVIHLLEDVSSPREWSTISAHHWQEEGNGRFSMVPGQLIPPNCGYSWLDLYLMGLAAPSEVPFWFYIRDPQPIPGTLLVTGTKVPVSIAQVIEANGPRVPNVDNSPKEFTTLFVFLHRTGERMMPDQLQRLHAIRKRFVRTFETAVGRRARIQTAATPLPAASRAADLTVPPEPVPTDGQPVR